MAKERWSDRGEMPDLENEKVSAPKSSRSWTVEDVAHLKARVLFVPNRWNWLCDKLDSVWGLSVFFFAIFTIAFGPWVFDAWFGIGKNAALNAAFMLFYGIVIGFILTSKVANKLKARPPIWKQTSLGDFYEAHGEIVAMPEFQVLLATLVREGSPYMPAWTPFVVESCDKATVIIVWRLRYNRVTRGVPPTETTRLEYADKVPMVVFDVANKRLVDPELLPRSVPMDPTIIIG